MSEPYDAPATWVQDVMRDFQDKLTRGLYEAIYALDPPSTHALMCAQGRACSAGFLELAGLRGPLSLEELLNTMRFSGPSQVDIHRDGNIIFWEERHEGECVCPFVRRGVIRLDRQLCICGAHWVKYLFEHLAATPVDVDIVSTVATGARNCFFVVRLRATSRDHA